MDDQLSLFDYADERQIDALWEPRDIWINFSESLIERFKEDGRVEYKSLQNPNWARFAEYYSMFSNTTAGGVLIFGISDSGNLEGLNGSSLNEINKLESFHATFCTLSKPESKRIPVNDGGDFIMAVYLPYVGQLVETNKAKSYIRYGDNKHEMSEEERQDFRSTRHQRTWETSVADLAYPHDFDSKAIDLICDGFRARENKIEWTNEAVLLDRLLLTPSRAGVVPTNALVLLAAKQPRHIVSGARVKLQRFRGDEQGAGESFSPIKDTYIEGNIISILEHAQDHVTPLNYDITWLDKNGKFQTTSEYPQMAWFEALVNALVHRSYSYSGSEISIKFFSDRLEIESPGSFIPPVNAENILQQRASRNANICEALRYVGFTRMSREGTRRIVESMKSYNLPDPIFSEETTNGVSVKVTLINDIMSRERTSELGIAKYCGTETWKTLQDHEITIVAYAYKNGRIQVNEASSMTGRTWNTSKKDLRKLTEKGLLEFNEGRFQRDPKAHYRIVEDRIPDEYRR